MVEVLYEEQEIIFEFYSNAGDRDPAGIYHKAVADHGRILLKVYAPAMDSQFVHLTDPKDIRILIRQG